MDEHKEVIEKRKDRIKNWLKDRQNLIFIGIIILAIAIRLYYFNLTKNQPLWWDESDYLAYAKNIAGYPINWIITAQHNSIYPYIAAFFFMFGLNEAVIKLLLQIIPSILSVLLIYFICNEMYEDKRIGLIASFLMTTFWLHIFNSVRFHIDIPALFFGLLAFYVFWRGYENKKKIFGKLNYKWAIPITVLLVIATYTIRRGYFLFGFFFLIYMLLTKNWKELVKEKYNWIALAFALILIFLAEKLIFGSAGIGGVGEAYFHEEYPITFASLNVFKEFFKFSSLIWANLLFYLFWIGFFILIANISLSFGYIKKVRKSSAKADLFNIIAIIITLAFFILVLRTPDAGGIGESRWYFPLILGALIAISRTSLIAIDYIKLYNKYVGLGLLILVIALSGYYQIKQADEIIKNRANSFSGIREASLFLKEISNKEEVIISVAVPQVMYYAERNVMQPDKVAGWKGAGEELPMDDFINKLKEMPEAKYLLISFSQIGHPPWMTTVYGNNNQIAGWEIPFMDTKVDFANQKQDIKQSKTYDGMTFTLLAVKQDVFIYRIDRI